MNRLLIGVFWVLLTIASLPSVFAKDSDWPRTVPLEQGMVTIYSLQVDEMSGNTIQFRAALAYRATTDSEPVFGAGWFESPVEIDTAKRIAHPTDLKVTETRFPAGTDDVQPGLSEALALQSPGWNLDFSLDELDTALKTAEAETKAAQGLSTAPPRIIYRDHPALLVSMDGEAVLREIENSTYKAVINTPYPLIFDNRHYYLNAAKDVWYRADKATGPYQFETSPPADIAAMVNAGDQEAADELPDERVTAANAPEIVVSTVPAELVVTEGPAAFVPLVDDLLVLQNSDDDVFMHVSSQNFYIVLAGRWYQANSLNGPWTYQVADELPTAFANIPRDSDQADSLVYVAGTEEAQDAVLDAQVPQTAAVKRGEVDIEVKYDGKPVYETVDGTDLVYIENTGSTVLQSGGLFYLVENGVWYVSSSANGPWEVSDHRPVQVDTILPSSPVYNVKYVHVYDSTPEVVYVGYTPGYTGSYVYRNTIFYGTGWYYRPWVSPYYYYPRFSTWGFNVSYNSWSGWNFGLSWGWGPFSVGYYSGGYWHNNHYWHHRHYGHWGPRGYRARPKHHGYRGNRYANNGNRHGNSGRNDGRNDGRNGGRNERDGQRSNGNQRNDNLYRDGSQRARVADTRDNQPRSPDRRNSSTRQANYASANGTRQKNQSGLKKGERNRAGPVSTSDLRSKAVARDTNQTRVKKARVADNRDNQSSSTNRRNSSTRQANYASANGTRQKNQSGLKKGERNRAGPVSTSDLRTKANVRDVNIKAGHDKLLADNSGNVYRKADRGSSRSATSKRTSGKNGAKQTTQPTRGTSSRQSQIRVAESQPRRQSSSQANNASRQTQPGKSGNSTRQQSPRVVKTPTQKRTVSQASPRHQSSKNSVRTNSAPPQRPQSSGRSYSAPPQNSRNNSGNSAAPARSAPKNSTKKNSALKNSAPKNNTQNSNVKKNSSNKNRGSRSSGSRSRKS